LPERALDARERKDIVLAAVKFVDDLALLDLARQERRDRLHRADDAAPHELVELRARGLGLLERLARRRAAHAVHHRVERLSEALGDLLLTPHRVVAGRAQALQAVAEAD